MHAHARVKVKKKKQQGLTRFCSLFPWAPEELSMVLNISRGEKSSSTTAKSSMELSVPPTACGNYKANVCTMCCEKEEVIA